MTSMTVLDYTAKIEFDVERDVFRGEVLHVREKLLFEGRSVDELRTAFSEVIERYRDRDEGGVDAPASGRFVVRISPSLHRTIANAAAHDGVSLNDWVTDALERAERRDAPFTYYIKLINRADPRGARIAEYARRLVAMGMTSGRQSATVGGSGEIVTFTPNFRDLMPLDTLSTSAIELGFEVISVSGPNSF